MMPLDGVLFFSSATRIADDAGKNVRLANLCDTLGHAPLRLLRIKLKRPKNAIDEVEALLRDQTVVKTPTERLSLRISDPDDEWIVAEGMAGEADALDTGDAALQKIGKRAPMSIVSPRGLWETVRGAEPRR